MSKRWLGLLLFGVWIGGRGASTPRPARKPDGVQVVTNGANASALVGIATPVDLGSYDVAVTASGYRAWRKKVDVTEEGKLVTVVIDLAPVR